MFNLIKDDFLTSIGERVKNHRKNFYYFMLARYLELLPLVITYENCEDIKLDKLFIEQQLRSGNSVVIGETSLQSIRVLGVVRNPIIDYSTTSFTYQNNIITKEDIDFIIPNHLQLDEYVQLTPFNDTGNFVVLKNKSVNLISDIQLVEFHINELSEIANARFTNYLQSKSSTILRGTNTDDEDMNKIASDWYNGVPYIKTTMLFDIEENLINLDVSKIVQLLPELKREFQNKIAELNAVLGLNSLGVDKESGVSDIEAQSNRSFKKSNENLYLRARNEPLELLNKKYGLNIHAEYVDSAVKELSSLEKFEKVVEG